MEHLVKLLLAGYGLAATGAGAVWLAGGTILAAVGTFWIGGAVAVLALATVTARALERRPLETADTDADAAMLAQCLRQWEEDRRADSRSGSDDRHASGQ